MDEQQSLDLQVWCFRNLSLNICLREQHGGRWTVLLGLPDGSRRLLDGSPLRLAFVPDRSLPSPRPAVPALLGAGGQLWLRSRPRLKRDEMGSDPAEHAVLHDVPVSCLRGDTFPVLYDGLEGRTVLVFSRP